MLREDFESEWLKNFFICKFVDLVYNYSLFGVSIFMQIIFSLIL